MAIQMNEKQILIQSLLAAKTKCYTAEFELLLKGNADKAEQVKIAGKVLSKQIDSLIAQTMVDWIGDANELNGKVKLVNTKIQRTISEIKNDVNTVNNVIKLVEFIDDIVGIASSLV